MIVLSFVLVLVAAVTLIVGFFQGDNLEWIYVSIASCVTAMVLLGVGVLQRRSVKPVTEPDYGPGAAPSYPAASARPAAARPAPSEPGPAPTEVTVVPKRSASPWAAADDTEPVAPEPTIVPAATAKATAARRAPAKMAAKAPAKKAAKQAAKQAAKKAPAKQAAKKAPAKQAAKKAAKKAPAKQAAKKATTGKGARDALAQIKGLGPAKQDALLKQFPSLEAIKAASVEEIAAVKGVGKPLARQLKQSL